MSTLLDPAAARIADGELARGLVRDRGRRGEVLLALAAFSHAHRCTVLDEDACHARIADLDDDHQSGLT